MNRCDIKPIVLDWGIDLTTWKVGYPLHRLLDCSTMIQVPEVANEFYVGWF